ncbi:Isatin hydrolase like protein [Argiope bruennichi]|uniref:Isatin hydrolase like protein n=2 Tax=Argiope bruennichi TaxID=94029 RepID=A0A8T0EU22_ARGBR|nr:Isatin hydrolase like protein [Argiope bruennichi]
MVDLTHTVDETARHYPLFKDFELTVLENGTREERFWLQTEEHSSTTHAGTHMDAPSHFTPGGLNIDQIPIDQFIGPAAVIDITQRASLDPDTGATVNDLIHWENTTGKSLDGTIILIRSGWGSKYHNITAYAGTAERDITKMVFPGLEPEAAQWLVDNRKIKGIGVDTISFDKGTSLDFLSHQILLGHGIFGLENVANMELIPIYGATLHVMPMKMAKASGSPTRVVATFPDVIFS